MRPSRIAFCLFGLFLTAPLTTLFGQSEVRKLSHSEAMNAVVSKVAPEYPPIAKQLKLEGIVELEATIGENGIVESIKIVSGNPVLTKPASEAVRKWKFQPQTESGKPAKALAAISVVFKL